MVILVTAAYAGRVSLYRVNFKDVKFNKELYKNVITEISYVESCV